MSETYRDPTDDEPTSELEETGELLPSSRPAGPTSSSPISGQKARSAQEIDDKRQQVQSQLLEIQRQQEEMEKQQRELEELGRKQSEFDEGKEEVVERLTRGLVVLERQQVEVEREAEQIKNIFQQFQEQLDQIKGIRPEDWGSDNLHEELTRSLAVIDKANATHLQARTRLSVLQEDHQRHEEPEYSEEEEATTSSAGMSDMIKAGFAFSLPFMLFLLLLVGALVVIILYIGTQPAP